MHTSPQREKELALQQLDFRPWKNSLNTWSFQDCEGKSVQCDALESVEICYRNNGKLVQCMGLNGPDE